MKHFAIINAAGDILRTGSCPGSGVFKQAGDGEEVLLVNPAWNIRDDTHRYDAAQGGFVPYTPEVIPPTYSEQRARKYPPISEQLDAMWKMVAELQTQGVTLGIPGQSMLDNILAVKATHPKSVSETK